MLQKSLSIFDPFKFVDTNNDQEAPKNIKNIVSESWKIIHNMFSPNSKKPRYFRNTNKFEYKINQNQLEDTEVTTPKQFKSASSQKKLRVVTSMPAK